VQPLWRLYEAHFWSHTEIQPDIAARARDVARALVDYRQIDSGSAGIAFARGGMAITLNSIAQGYITGRPMKISRSAQTCALGSAVAAAVVAGAHKNFSTAQKAMTGLKPRIFKPNAKAHAVYRELYTVYKQLHDAFGREDWNGNLYGAMKQLIEIRQKARSAK